MLETYCEIVGVLAKRQSAAAVIRHCRCSPTCRLRKNTELTGIRLVLYEKRPASSSDRKPESSRKYGGAFGEMTLTRDSYLRI